MLDWILGFFSTDLAIDLGTANTLVSVRGRGIVLNEPSVVAVKKDARGPQRVVAVGLEAREMLGRTPGSITTIRPLKDGVIADLDVCEAMLRYFIQRAHGRSTFVRPRIVVCIPFGINEVEKRAVRDAAGSAGAREVFLLQQPMAAAMGAGLPVTEPQGNMIVDIGGGTTQVAVISLGGIVVSQTERIAGDKMDHAIIEWCKGRHNLLIGERTAEQVKVEIGCAWPLDEEKFLEIRGRDLVKGVPKTIELGSHEILEALRIPVHGIVEAVKLTLERTPPELSADIIDKGIMLAGGSSLLTNLDVLLREETGLPVLRADDPLLSVVKGSGMALDSIDLLRRVAERT
jgi:rod shape-determining protein MreB